MNTRFLEQLSAPQLRVAEAVSSLQRASRLVVVGRTGSGKTHAVAAGLAARDASPEVGNPRILVVAGARVLAEQWAWTFERMGERASVVDPSRYRDLQLHTAHGDNPWKTPNALLVATYIDFAKHPKRLEQLLEATWEVIVLDDLPATTPDSQRHRAFHALWDSEQPCPRVLVAWTGEAGAVPDSGSAVVLKLDTDFRRWATTAIAISYSTGEAQHLEWIYTRASKLPGIVGQTMLRRAGSSLFALEQSLIRLTVKVPEGVETSGTPDDAPSLSPADRIEISEITPILDAVENLERDAKWDTLHSALTSMIGTGPVVVFTEYADTAEYLSHLLVTVGVPAIAITGRMPYHERAAAFEETRAVNRVLAVSSPVGPPLPAVSGIFHYDLPADPRRLVERYELAANSRHETTHRVIADPVFDQVQARSGSA